MEVITFFYISMKKIINLLSKNTEYLKRLSVIK